VRNAGNRDFVVDTAEADVGLHHLFRPTYALANVGHPSCT
jgi:hypothetical protein